MDSKEINSTTKRGYLKKDFQVFHLKDKRELDFELHYHEFSKIVIFISGKVTYLIEGKAYKLKSWDIILVNSNEVHKAIIDSSEVYERIIIWLDPSFISKHNYEGCDLLNCFNMASKEKFNLLRLKPQVIENIKSTISQLEKEANSDSFGGKLLSNALLIQFIIFINRLFIEGDTIKELEDIEFDESIGNVLEYINNNLENDLSIDKLSNVFFMSKYHLMHKFKIQTGYTIHKYILQKRLIFANNLIKSGKSVISACNECGFKDYSNFVRAFKKMFGVPPKSFKGTI